MNIAYIGLGANLGNAVETLKAALQDLDQAPGCEVLTYSSFYRSRPLADMDQPDYINSVAALRVSLTPYDLLQLLQKVENAHGRERLARWGARTLDLDILLYGNMQIETPQLTIPHVGLREREFVVFPLLEIAPQLILPDGQSLAELARGMDLRGMEKIVGGEHA